MELHELHIGHGSPGPVGHGNPVAGGNIRIAGVQIDLAGAAAGQQGGAGREGQHTVAVDIQHVGAQAAVVLNRLPCHLGAGDQVYGNMVFVDRDIGVLAHRFHQGPFDLPAGDIFGMQDPAGAVAPFAGQVVGIALGGGGKLHPPLDQIADGGRTFLNHHPDDLFVTDVGPGRQGVLNMGIKGVFG